MPECTCDVRPPTHASARGRCGASKYAIYLDDFDDPTITDPDCPFHGDNGSMVVMVNVTALSSTGPRPHDPQPTPDAAGLRAKEQHRDG